MLASVSVAKWVYPKDRPTTHPRISRGNGVQKACVVNPRHVKKSTLCSGGTLVLEGCGIVTLSDGIVVLMVNQENPVTFEGKPQILFNGEPVQKGCSYPIQDGDALYFRPIDGRSRVIEHVFDLRQ